jgi:ribosomal protein L29
MRKEMIQMTTQEIENKIKELKTEWLNLRWYRHVEPEERKRVEEVKSKLIRFKGMLKYIQHEHKWEISE